jgi:hypothetical protein
VAVMVMKEEVAQISLMRKQRKDNAGKMTLVDSMFVSSKCND